jgi:kinesin family member C1
VYVRCRPFLRCDGDEVMAGQASLTFHPEGTSVSVAVPGRTGQSFNFDHVFSMESSQEDVYSNIEDLVQSALDGYRVCIFSYGQTGSGKTHTMTGDPSDEGIIPRSVRQILSNAIELQNNAGWKISLEASIVELYNEDVRDLLCPAAASSALAGSDKDKLKISIMQGRVNVSGLLYSEIELTDTESGMMKLNKLLQDAAKSRTVACTGMNEHSSRSHVLFMLDITCTHGTNGTVLHGGLKLVDLAGSERLNRTGTLNDAVRLKETVNINKSLSSLSDVFTALANKASHVPYRNSKLTMLLQDCLSGDGKALMFVNVSPTVASSQETLCSLRFANQVSQVELGKARKSVTQLTPAQIIPSPSMMVLQAPILQSSSQESTVSVTSIQQSAVSAVSSNAQISRRSSMSFNPLRNASVSLASSKEVATKLETIGNSSLPGNITQEATICKSSRLSVLTGAKRMVNQTTSAVATTSGNASSSTIPISQQLAMAKRPKTGCWR